MGDLVTVTTELEARLQRFADSGDHLAVLAPQALELGCAALAAVCAAETVAAAADPLRLVGWLRWFRCDALTTGPEPDRERAAAEEEAAVRLFTVLYRVRPDLVPPSKLKVITLLAEAGLSATPASRDLELADLLLPMARAAGDPDGIARSIATYRRVLGAGGDPDDRLRVLVNLSIALADWARHTGDLRDLDAVITETRSAERQLPPGDPRRAQVVQNLGVALQWRYEHTGDPACLEESLRMRRQALLEPAAPDDPQRPARLSGLSIALRMRYELTGDLAGLEEAIGYGRQAVRAAEDLGGPPGSALSMLANALTSRHEATGSRDDLDEAVSLHQAAVRRSPPADPERPMCLFNLGTALKQRYRLAGRPEDLDESIRVTREALASSAAPDPVRQSGLSAALLDQYERTGRLADLNEAVQAARAAVALIAAGDARRSEPLTNLCLALRMRFEQAGDIADIDGAVAAGREAVAATVHDRERGAHLTNLSSSLQVRYDKTQDPADLEEAVAASQAAVAACPEPHPDRAGALSVLGLALRTRDEAGGRAAPAPGGPGAADDAVRVARQAVAATAAADVMRPGRLANLATALYARFTAAGQVEDAGEAVRTVRAALKLYPDGHPAQATCLSNLGHFLRGQSRAGRADGGHDPGLLREALTAWRQGSQLRTAPARTRLACAANWARTAAGAGLAAEAEAGYTAFVATLPLVAWRGLNRETQEDQLAVWGRLTTEAAAAAVTAGHPRHAVELLEQGRAILWAQLLQTRDEADALRRDHPELGQRLDLIRAALDAEPDGQAVPAEQRMHAAAEWDRLVDEIRTRPGYETFLAAPRFADLSAATAAGPVVIVNVSAQRCDALAVTPAGVQVIPLPGLAQADADRHAASFARAISRMQEDDAPDAGRAASEATDAVLAWLWSAVTGPVLRALDLVPPPGPAAADARRPPRVWWCPTGSLTRLPVHAAAPGGAVAGAIDHVVSSYLPTLRTLRDARSAAGPAGSAGPGPDRLLLVTMPDSPDGALPGSAGEESVVRRRFAGPVAAYRGQDARTGPVAAAAAGHTHVHFACHGRVDPGHPDQSGLRLHDGVLTIGALSRIRRQPAGLAFLSACDTAAGSTRHPDEAITMGAAMHVAGFRHVIATLWSIADSVAPDVADDVYAALSGPDGRLSLGGTAVALNCAVRRLRARGLPALWWAPYLHSGP